jgi:hypothetical protein
MHSRKIFLGRDGETHGPYSEQQISQFQAEGRVAATDLVWWEGQTAWLPASEALAALAPEDADAHPRSLPDPASPHPLTPDVAYHHVAPLKFAILSVATLGLYEMFWFYKNWQYVRQRDASRIRPFWRAVFSPLWCFSLARDLANHDARWTTARAGMVAAAYAFLVLASRLSDPWWLLTLGTFLPLLALVSTIHAANCARGVKSPYYARFGVGPVAACLVGAPFLALTVLLSLNVLPATQVVDGQNLPSWHRNYLRAQKIVEDPEVIQHFYSSGFFSIKDDGNLLTDQRIISYWRDPTSQELEVASARYEDIQDLQLERGDALTDSTLTVVHHDGSEFILLLSTEADGDQRCLETAQTLRQRRQPSPP